MVVEELATLGILRVHSDVLCQKICFSDLLSTYCSFNPGPVEPTRIILWSSC